MWRHCLGVLLGRASHLRRVLLRGIVRRILLRHVLRSIDPGRRVRVCTLRGQVLRRLGTVPGSRNGEVELLVESSLCVRNRHVSGILWLVLALLILETDLPTGEKLWPGLDVAESWIFTRALELATNNVFEGVVRDDVMVGSLVLDRDGLLHQTALLELVAVNQRAAEATLLVGRQALGKVGIYLIRGFDRGSIASHGSLEDGVVVLVF